MDNEDIKEKEGEDLIFQEKQLSMEVARNLNVKGLPLESKEHVPLVVLVPHLRAQSSNYSVSMLNISSIL